MKNKKQEKIDSVLINKNSNGERLTKKITKKIKNIFQFH